MNNLKHQLHVLHTESIYSRGGEKYLFELLKRVEKTHAVHLYLHRISPRWLQQYKKYNIDVHLLWTPPRLFWLLLPVTLLVNFFELKKTTHKKDVLFATNFPMNFLAVILSKNAICHCFEPLAIFYDPVRISSLSLFSRFCVAVAKYMYAPLDKWAYTKSAVLTALGPSVEPYIIKTYGKKPDIYLRNGVDCNFFSAVTNQKRHPNKPFILGHSTDYTIFKGTEDFLAIVAFLKKTKHPIEAHISESIPDQEAKKKYLRYIKQLGIVGDVKFVGNISERNLPKYYQSLDVFVYTGSPECAGGSTASLSVLEAQSCGIPVIRSNGDDHEIIDGKTGYYINPHDYDDAGQKIIQVLTLPELSKHQIKRAARTYIRSRFDWNFTGKVLIKTIQKLEL